MSLATAATTGLGLSGPGRGGSARPRPPVAGTTGPVGGPLRCPAPAAAPSRAPGATPPGAGPPAASGLVTSRVPGLGRVEDRHGGPGRRPRGADRAVGRAMRPPRPGSPGARAGGPTAGGGRAGPVGHRLRADPVPQDLGLRRAGHPGMGGTGGGGQCQDRPPRPHHRPPRVAGAVHCFDPSASTGLPRSPWSPVAGRPHLARGPPGGGRPHRGGQDVGRHHERRRLLVRHRHQDAGPPAVRRRLRRAARWPTWSAGWTPRRRPRCSTC